MGTSINPPVEQQPVIGKGHGTKALGPSDTSDTGSDVVGGPGLDNETGAGIDLDPTTTDDTAVLNSGAGPNIGDENLDSDSDSVGTGEHATIGRDVPADRDISVDHIENINDASDVRARNKKH